MSFYVNFKESHNYSISKVICAEFKTNAYILIDKKSNDCMMIDCILDYDAISYALNYLKAFPNKIICTHGHFDHIGCAGQVQEQYGCAVYLNPADNKLAKSSNFLLMACGSKRKIILPTISDLMLISDSFKQNVGMEIIQSPGHSKGSVIIKIDGLFFTGDTIYANRMGLSKLPGENLEQLRFSIDQVIDQIIGADGVFPGHGKTASGVELERDNRELMIFLNRIG